MTEKCVLCGKDLENEYGNNPWPLAEEGVCCDECNDLVTATRMSRITGDDPENLARVLRLTRLQAIEMLKKREE